MNELLKVENLSVTFDTDEGALRAVDEVSFSVERGRTLGIVGESGCGKSVANLTILGLTRGEGTTVAGKIDFEGHDLVAMDNEALRGIRGNQISMIFQDPLSSLHPFYTVGSQLAEAVNAHAVKGDVSARKRAIELLELVQIPDATRRAGEYPHEFSGGMRQRAMIAMGLANSPEILIADEPTTALDVTTQAQILDLLKDLQDDLGMAVIMITHDLGVVAEAADDVLVMYAGRVVESGTLEQIFYDPQHPYTWGLLGSITRLDRPRGTRLAQISGQPPSLVNIPPGCRFAERCPHVFDRCAIEPALEARVEEKLHRDRCWLPADRKRGLRTLPSGDIGLEVR